RRLSSIFFVLFFLVIPRPPVSTLFPYTTLFRSWPNRATFAIGATDWGFYLNFHETGTVKMAARPWLRPALDAVGARAVQEAGDRSEEHTSELQSRENLVCRLLLEKKKKTHTYRI